MSWEEFLTPRCSCDGSGARSFSVSASSPRRSPRRRSSQEGCTGSVTCPKEGRLYAELKYDRLPELAAELVRLKPDVIVTGGTMNITAVKHATTTIPVVMTWAPDPVGDGLIASLRKPGGNTTGVSATTGTEFIAKQLQILKSEAGLLLAYGINFEAQHRRAAIYAGRILSGAKPADLPVEQPTKFELVINMKTAKAPPRAGRRDHRVSKG